MKHLLTHIDWRLVTPVAFLVIISLTMLYSMNPEYFSNQFFGLIISIFAFLLFSQISYRDFRFFPLQFYLVAIGLLVFVFILGFESRGAIRWVEIFGKSLQASEVGKPLLSLSLAGYLAGNSNKLMKTYLFSILFLIPVVFLIYLQPDLGNALLYAGVCVITLVIYGLPWIWLIVSMVPLFFLTPFFWRMLHEYQRQRVFTFFDPLRDPSGSSYNVIQAIIAVGSGMVFGKGISEGTQSRLQFLPENHTDFIFASLAEKLGFLGSLLVLVLFFILFYRIYQIFRQTKDDFGRVFVICMFLFTAFQFFVNIGMNLGIVPVVGVTLPFVSFGGSSLLANFISLGILSSISVRNNVNEVLEIS